MTHIQPNLTSNLPSVTRVDLVARQNPAPKRAVAEYTDAAGQMERALLRAMLEATRAKREAVKVESKQAPASTPRMCTKEVAARLSAAINTPKTAAQIAEEAGLACSTVKTHLNKMARAGEIEAFEQPRHSSGYHRPFLYAVNGTFDKPYDFSRSRQAPVKPELRAAVLALLAKPHAPFEVAKALGINPPSARYQIQRLAAYGLIRRAGKIATFRSKEIQQWVAK